MNKQFSTYKELIEEKQKLEALLKAQKELVRYDVQELKLELQPFRDVASNIRKLVTKDKTSLLLNIGSDAIINTVVKKILLGRAGWLTRLVVPYFMKNYSSHFLAEQKEKWLDKLTAWMHRNKNGKDHKKEEQRENEEDVF
jgi:hypothetical protein